MLKNHLKKSPFRTLDMMRLLVTVWSIVVGLILKVVIRFLHNFHELFRPMMPKQYGMISFLRRIQITPGMGE